MKSFLRWAGGKKQLLDAILRKIPQFDGRYIEPFVGSGTVFYAIEPNEAIISDTNKVLIGTYNAIKRSATRVFDVYSSLQPTEIEYYRIRGLSPHEVDPITRAGHFIYLNRYCFNGLYRTNRDGKFNVPFGMTKGNGVLPSLQTLMKARCILRRTQCFAWDFERTIRLARPGDFVFLDPPYFNPDNSVFAGYGANTFSENDFARLVDCINELNDAGIPFLMTFSNTKLARDAFMDYFTNKHSVRRSISGFSNGRKRENELLISNYRGRGT